jgi:AraC-like DNA-binding protein
MRILPFVDEWTSSTSAADMRRPKQCPKERLPTLENSLLSLPPLTEKTDTLAPSDSDYPSFSDDLVGSLRQVLMTYLHEPKLSIELAAALCHTSKRSLQRRLAESGTSYSKVLEHARYDVARQERRMRCRLPALQCLPRLGGVP